MSPFASAKVRTTNFLRKLNEQYKFFGEIVPLPHPRFIMQYKLKQKEAYIERYLKELCNYKKINK